MKRDLLWIDSRGGLAAGIGMLTLSAWLSRWYGLPRELLLAMGVANVSYGLYSGWLFARPRRAPAAIAVLVCANAAYATACLVGAYHFALTSTLLGVIHLLGEGLFVGALAWLEWMARNELVTPPPRSTGQSR
jgi:hypothetical protein